MLRWPLLALLVIFLLFLLQWLFVVLLAVWLLLGYWAAAALAKYFVTEFRGLNANGVAWTASDKRYGWKLVLGGGYALYGTIIDVNRSSWMHPLWSWPWRR